MKTKKIVCICTVVVLVGGFIGFSVYTLLKVKIEKGVAKNMSDIPIIGVELSDFPAEGEIKYLQRRYFGGAGIYFAGKASNEAVSSFFEKHSWDSSLGSASYDHIFADEPCFPIVPSEDNEVYVKLPDEESNYKITIYYMPATETFSGMALIFYR